MKFKDFYESSKSKYTKEELLQIVEADDYTVEVLKRNDDRIDPKIMTEIMKMSDSSVYSIWPSSWRDTEYPENMMRALLASPSRESLNDLANIYYSNRRFTPAAEKLLVADVLKNPLRDLRTWGMSMDKAIGDHTPMVELFKARKDVAIAVLNKLSDGERTAVLSHSNMKFLNKYI